MEQGLNTVIRLETALNAAARADAVDGNVALPGLLLQRMPPIYVADRDGRFTLVSPECENSSPPRSAVGERPTDRFARPTN